MMLTLRVRLPVWLLPYAILAGDHTKMSQDRHLAALAKEAKEFHWQLAAEVFLTNSYFCI